MVPQKMEEEKNGLIVKPERLKCFSTGQPLVLYGTIKKKGNKYLPI